MSAMLGQAKPLASLSSTLLARKGTARPAMRPQGFGGFNPAPSVDDLGWNDMGSHDIGAHDVAPALTPAPAPVLAPVVAEPTHHVPVPPVLVAREALKEEIEAPSRELRPVSLATASRIGRESAKQTAKRKAAFTLRLDADRHLRLRLASAVVNCSSQTLVTEALDAFLKSLPEVEELASQLPLPKAKR